MVEGLEIATTALPLVPMLETEQRGSSARTFAPPERTLLEREKFDYFSHSYERVFAYGL